MKQNLFYLLILLFAFSCTQEKVEDLQDLDDDNNENSELVISNDLLPVSYDDIDVTDFDLASGEMTVQFKDVKTEVKSGHIICISYEENYYIRKVQEVISTKPYKLKTTEAGLSDIFTQGKITLSSEMGKSRSANGMNNVFYPEMIVYDNGDTINVSRAEITGRLLNKEFDLTRLNSEFQHADIDFFEFENGKIYSNLDFKLIFNFDSYKEASEVIKGRMLDVSVSLIGTMGYNYNALFIFNKEKSYEKMEKVDVKDLIKPRTVFFQVNPILKIPIIVSTDLMHDFNAHAGGEVTCRYGSKFELVNEIGFNYNQVQNETTPFYNRSETIDFTSPVITAKASMESKFSVYPRFKFMIYNLIGPEVDIKPYVRGKLDFLRERSIDYSLDALNFLAEAGLEIDSRIGNRIFSLEDYGIIDLPTLKLFNMELYRSPYKIELDDYDEKNNSVSFVVYDTIPFMEKSIPTSLNSPVVFSNNNKEGKDVLYTTEGRVTKQFEGNCIGSISAKIYDTKKNIIDEAVYEYGIREFLINLYQQANGDNWTRNDNWCSEKPINEWYGVDYYSEYYLNLNLANNNLSGNIILDFNNFDLSGDIIISGENIESIEIKNIDNNNIRVEAQGKNVRYNNCKDSRYIMQTMESNQIIENLEIINCESDILYIIGDQNLKSLSIENCRFDGHLLVDDCNLTSIKLKKIILDGTINIRYNQLLNSLSIENSTIETITISSNQSLGNIDFDNCTIEGGGSISGCPILQQIPQSMESQFYNRILRHDARYYYWDEPIYDSQGNHMGDKRCHRDNGVGWWFAGEPERGYHIK